MVPWEQAPRPAQISVPHPNELCRTLRDNDDARSVNYHHGPLSMVVQQLTKARFITPLETHREGQRPERTGYALTDAGRHELRDRLSEPIAEQRAQIRRHRLGFAFLTFDPAPAGANVGMAGLVQRVLALELHAWFVAMGWLAYRRS